MKRERLHTIVQTHGVFTIEYFIVTYIELYLCKNKNVYNWKWCRLKGTNYNTVAKKFKISREANSSKFPVTIKQISQKELATKAITPKICMTSDIKTSPLTILQKSHSPKFPVKNRTKIPKRICYQATTQNTYLYFLFTSTVVYECL